MINDLVLPENSSSNITDVTEVVLKAKEVDYEKISTTTLNGQTKTFSNLIQSNVKNLLFPLQELLQFNMRLT